MKARPILFSGDMVRALLDGRKTQTRRVVKATKDRDFGCELSPGEIAAEVNQQRDFRLCPYGQPGDLLWVRETWFQKGRYVMPAWPEAEPEDAVWSGSRSIQFATEGQDPESREDGRVVWRKRPSIHMPRWASRLTLRITSVRVERLRDISEADIKAEGVAAPITNGWCDDQKWRSQFMFLWESINGADSWAANPWVWVIEFEVIKANVDQVPKEVAA